jgi:hypothetical protein
MDLAHVRSTVVDRIRSQLFGPAGEPDESLVGKPYWRYMSGILFPQDVQADDLGESDEPDASDLGSDDDVGDSAVGLSYRELPSSMGISFFVQNGTSIKCEIEGAIYERASASEPWKRRALATEATPSVAAFDVPPKGVSAPKPKAVLDGRGQVSMVFRPRPGGHLVTTTLVNAQKTAGRRGAQQTEAMLFQCRMRVTVDGGSIGEYPSARRYSRHQEDEELALVYRRRKTFGIGHGCSAVWPDVADAQPRRSIVAEPLPVTAVRGLTNEIDLPAPARPCLSLTWLAKPRPANEMAAVLGAFVEAYERWTTGQRESRDGLTPPERPAADRICERQAAAVRRMRRGVAVLTSGADPNVARAFQLAQEAMLTQFLWAGRQGTPLSLGEGHVDRVDPGGVPPDKLPIWRPFQLAFQLLTVASIVDSEDEDRLTLDLLWFPTGGGKTEAYLALTALEIILRRLRYGDAGAGTAVIMRYTLRLLTSQQFERCATLIAVLEDLRRQRPEIGLGAAPITVGLWVGAATTPNRLTSDDSSSPGAVQLVERLRTELRPDNPFQLLACPFCGTRIVPIRRSPASHYGVEATPARFRMFCPDDRCILHESIPVSVVDDDLYARAPSLLIGTIDKFARMVWEPRSRAFFGFGESETLPPSLVIQDELHLINGPLGTIAGVYEAGVDTILRSRGSVPKYIAATATIQRAAAQCRALYDREAFIFPPLGLDASDSFYSREDRTGPGRLFIGVMGPGLYSALTSLVQVSAAAADAVSVIPELDKGPDGQRLRDAYWTQVIYHNSRQELGKTTTMLRDDVLTRLQLLEPVKERRRQFNRVEELSANLKGAEVSDALDRLKVSYPKKDVTDALACTNMISVGVDVARLGLMIVKGQPKSTAEYIQASSRVGRSSKRPPGIVIALYTSFRPRDRSHYETFLAYHQSLYRGVEPSTVTPFSPPALDRTLHAALVMTVRHVLAMIQTGDAGRFDPADGKTRQLLNALRRRLEEAALPSERALVCRRFEELVAEWAQEIASDDPRPFVFQGSKQYHALLRRFEVLDEREGLWRTLNSMRHVDGETRFDVEGA